MLIQKLGVLAVASILTASAAFSGIPARISFQGRLLNADGNPVADGTYSITFKLYDTFDTIVWSEKQLNVQTQDGLFSVLLGSASSLSSVDFSGPLELGVTVSGDTEMTPRFQLAAAPYAMMAQKATDLILPQQLSTSSVLGLQVTTDNVFGTALRGTASSSAGTTYGVYGEATSPNGYGVYSQGRLHATGAISSASNIIAGNEFRYSSAKTMYIGLPACAFIKGNMNATNVWMVTYNEGGYVESGASPITVHLFAPVYLPDGATVTAIYAYCYDNNATNDLIMNVYLMRRELSVASATTMASFSVTTNDALDTVRAQGTTSISSPSIANDGYQYFINVIWQPGTYGNTLRFYGCRIEYQLQNLRP